MKKVMIIVNPSSGEKKGEEYALQLETRLEEKYDSVELRRTTEAGDASKFAKRAATDHYDAIFILGGDGTINEAVNGLAEVEHRPTIGILPTGTMNNFANQLELPNNPRKTIQNLYTLEERALDIGKINDQYFISSISIGTIPEAVQDVSAEEKAEKGIIAYIRKGLDAFSESEGNYYHLNIDGEEVTLHSSFVMAVLGHGISGIKNILPDASLEDGQLNLLALKGEEIQNKWSLIPKIFTGQLPDDDQIFHRSFTHATIDVEGEEEMKSNVDGDEGNSLPVELTILPQHLTFFVPKKLKRKNK